MRGRSCSRWVIGRRSALPLLMAVGGTFLVSCGGHNAAPSSATAPATAVADTSKSAGGQAAWQLVGLGDSFTATQNSMGRTYLDLFAASLQESQGRAVTFTDLSDDANTTMRLLDHLRTDESTRAAVGNADIVVISVGGNDSDPFGVYPAGTCSPAQSLSDCLTVYAPTFAANYQSILAEVVGLRSGKATSIRVTSADNPFVGWSEAPTATFGVDFYAQVAEAQTEAACAAAMAHDALCVDYLHIFGGADGTADPAPFLGPDHSHPGDVGIQAISDALVQLGVPELQ